MEKSIKEQYQLPKESHEEIYKKIEQEVFNRVSSEEKPIAIIVGGQSGSGKGSIISYSKQQVENAGKNITIITTDEYKPYHPNAIEIAKKYPTEYVEIVEQEAGMWTGEILKKAIDSKYNFIFEGTLKNDRILERIKELKQNGFFVTVRALAVSRLESLISIFERYQKQIDNMGWGRLISVEHHNKAYEGIPQVVDKIEKSQLCTIEIFRRGEDISHPQRIYTSKNNNDIYPTARIALEEYRKLDEYKTRKTAKYRIQRLNSEFRNRKANDKEMSELKKLEEYVCMYVDQIK